MLTDQEQAQLKDLLRKAGVKRLPAMLKPRRPVKLLRREVKRIGAVLAAEGAVAVVCRGDRKDREKGPRVYAMADYLALGKPLVPGKDNTRRGCGFKNGVHWSQTPEGRVRMTAISKKARSHTTPPAA